MIGRTLWWQMVCSIPSSLHRWMQLRGTWTSARNFPATLLCGSTLKNLHLSFSAKRKASNKAAGVFKCDASDELSLCPLVVHYMQKTFVPASMLLKETNAT